MSLEEYLERDDVPVNLKEAIKRKITEYKRTEEELHTALKETQQHEAEVLAMLEASRAILEYHKFADSARSIFDSCKNLIEATAGYVALLSEDGTENELLFLESGRLPCTVDPSLPMPIRGLRAEAYATGKAVYNNDFSNSEWMKYMPEGHVRLENVIFAPLIIEEKAVGLLGLANKQGGFTEKDAMIASMFGELAAIALHNSGTLESLESSEKRFRSVVETANDGIIIIQDWIKYVNPKFVEISGFPSEEAIGKSFFDFVSSEYQELVVDRYEKTIAGEKVPERFEIELLTKLGGKIPIEINISRIEYEGKSAEMGIIRDITERKQLEQQLVESEAKYRTLVERDPNMIFYIEGRVLKFVNQAFLDTLGYSKEELYDPHFDFFATIIPEQREMFKDHLIEILIGEDVPASYELSLLTKQAEVVPCLCNLTSFEREGKQVIQVVITDISLVKELEKEIKGSEERYRGLYESSIDGIVSYDMERNIKECNQSFADMHGYSKEELYQLSLWDLIYEKWHDIPDKIRAEVIKKGYSEEFDEEHIRKDGRIFPVSVRVWLMKDKDSRPTGMWGIVRDITERKRAENALKMVAYSLRERVKELRCLFNISELVDTPDILLEEILQGVVEFVLSGWQYPESACARVILKDQEFKTENFRETIWKQASGIFVNKNQIGALEVYYLDKMPDGDEGPFMKEERSLINAIAERIGKIITRKQNEKQLKEYTENLEKIVAERTKALRESEEKLTAILTGIGDFITMQNKDLDIIWTNQAIKDIWGDVIGKKCYEVYKGYDTCCPECTAEKVFNEGKTSFSEGMITKPDGTQIFIMTTSSPVLDAEGNIIAAVEVVKDITERKRAEDALQRSEASLAEAQRIAHLGNWDWHIQTNELHWSDEIYRIFGLEPQEFGATYEAFIKSVHPEDREFVKKSVDKALFENIPYSIDHRIILPDGEERIVHEQAEVIFDEIGKPFRMIGTVQDITENKKAEERHRESENRLSLIFNSVSDSILFIKVEPDDRYQVISVNQAFLTDTGFTEEQVIGNMVDEILPESVYKDLILKYKEIIRTSNPITYVSSVDLPKGHLTFETTITPIFDEKGNCTHLLGVATISPN